MRLHEKFGHVLTWTTLVNALPSTSGHINEPSCRFAHQHSQKQILQDPTAFINDMLYWEGKFHQNNISYNSNNGISYDGTNIDWVTGKATAKHTFSAASKEVGVGFCHCLEITSSYSNSPSKSCCIPTLLLALQRLLGSSRLRTQQRPPKSQLLLCRKNCRLISNSTRLIQDSEASCPGSRRILKI